MGTSFYGFVVQGWLRRAEPWCVGFGDRQRCTPAPMLIATRTACGDTGPSEVMTLSHANSIDTPTSTPTNASGLPW